MDSKAIGPSHLASLRTASAKTASPQSDKAAATAPSAAPRRPDVRLESLSMARDIATAGPPVDHAKVADLQQRLHAGRYEISPARLAEAMIRMDLL